MKKEEIQNLHEAVYNDIGLETTGSEGMITPTTVSGIESLPVRAYSVSEGHSESSNLFEDALETFKLQDDAYFASFNEVPSLDSKTRNIKGEEVVIGADDRVLISPTTAYPWRAICALRIRTRTGKNYIGTGWLISPRTVITAGHCLFMHNEGGWAQHIEVIPGLNGASRPFGSGVSSVLRSVTGWTNGQDRNFDYGAIILPNSYRPGDRTGYFGFANRSDNDLNASMLNLSGYPGDKGGNTQWFHARKTLSVTSRTILYDIDTYGGQSGSPVWVLNGSNRYAVGIHTNGGSSNSATRITQDVYNNMLNWKNQGL